MDLGILFLHQAEVFMFLWKVVKVIPPPSQDTIIN